MSQFSSYFRGLWANIPLIGSFYLSCKDIVNYWLGIFFSYTYIVQVLTTFVGQSTGLWKRQKGRECNDHTWVPKKTSKLDYLLSHKPSVPRRTTPLSSSSPIFPDPRFAASTCSFCDTWGKGWTSIPPPYIVTPELALAVQETEVCTFSHVEALPGPTNYARVKFRWLAHCRPSSISSVLCVLFKKARWALIVDSLWLIGRTFGCSIPSVVSSGPIGESWPSTRRMKTRKFMTLLSCGDQGGGSKLPFFRIGLW